MEHHHSLFPPGEASENTFTPEEEQDLLNAAQRRRERIASNKGPDWPVDIDKYLRRFVPDYEEVWEGFTDTGRWNRTVRVMRLPYCGSEKEYRFVYRGSGLQHIPISTLHIEASNMRKYEQLEKAGVFMHARAPKVYYTKHVTDGGRGPKDTPAVLCEFFEGATNAEDCISHEEELDTDTLNPEKTNTGTFTYRPTKRANPDNSLYWSERKRRKIVRSHALILAQMKLIQRPTISGGADNPMYDYAGTFENMGPRATQGELAFAAKLGEQDTFLRRDRAPEVADRRYRLGGYINEGEMIIEYIKRELAYWSTMDDETYKQIQGYMHTMGAPPHIPYYCSRFRITTYLSKLLEHLEVHHFYRHLHRFRDNENQLLGLFSLAHGDIVSGNNMMMTGDTVNRLIDFETTAFKPVAYDDDTITRTTYGLNAGWSPLDVGMATREELLHPDFTAPLSLENSFPFSGEIAPLADRYYRLTLFLQLDRFELGSQGKDPTDTGIETFKKNSNEPNQIASGLPYFSAAFHRFGPELNLEDFHYGDRYDTSMDDVPIPTSAYTPGLYYDSDDDPESDGPDAIDTQPIYDRMRLQAHEKMSSDPLYLCTDQTEARTFYDDKKTHGEHLKRRLLDSSFHEDWHHNTVHPLFRRFIDTKIQNAPMAWIPDPAYAPTNFADPSRPANVVCWDVRGVMDRPEPPEKKKTKEEEEKAAQEDPRDREERKLDKYPVHNSAYWGLTATFSTEPKLMPTTTTTPPVVPIQNPDIAETNVYGAGAAQAAAGRLHNAVQADLPSTVKEPRPYTVDQDVDALSRAVWRRERFGGQ